MALTIRGKSSCSQEDPNTINGKVVLIGGDTKNLRGFIARDMTEHGAVGIAIHYNSDSTHIEPMVQNFSMKKFSKIDITINITGDLLKNQLLKLMKMTNKSLAGNSEAAFFFIQEAGKNYPIVEIFLLLLVYH